MAVFHLASGGTATVSQKGRVVVRDAAGKTVSVSSCGPTYSYSRAIGVLTSFQQAVTDNDANRVAALLLYPLRYDAHGRTTMVRSRHDLVAEYRSLFSAHARRVITKPDPHALFCNDQGFMVGDGAVWGNRTTNGHYGVVTLNLD